MSKLQIFKIVITVEADTGFDACNTKKSVGHGSGLSGG